MKPINHSRSKYSLALLLLDAVEEQNLQDVITLLESEGADPNLVLLDKGISPFHIVIGSESYQFAEEATRVFLQHGGNPNTRSEDGLTPLHVAAVWGRTGLLVLLLLCGGDPYLRDCESGLTPLHLALKEKHWETALVLQRHQLLCRQNRNSTTSVLPRYNISLESVFVNTGDIQAEYGTSQENLSPVLMPPVQDIKRKSSPIKWNIDLVETQEYVQQWCEKEFSVHPVTSTPTRPAPPLPLNTVSYDTVDHIEDYCHKSDNYCSNMLCSNQMTPVDVNFGSTSAAKEATGASNCANKSFVKNTVDVRKKLFLEFRKRFNGLKHSFNSSKDTSAKTSEVVQNSSLSYFSRKKKKCNKNNDLNVDVQTDKNEICHSGPNPCMNFPSQGTFEQLEKVKSCDSSPTYFNFKSNVDEVDAVPLDDKADISLEWIASQSCFTEHPSPNSTLSQLYVTCDEGSMADKNTLKARINTPLPAAVCNVLNSAPVECLFKVPERPPRRKQLAALNACAFKSASETPSVHTVGAIVSEEYKYRDDEAGVILLENHTLSRPVDVPSQVDNGSVVSVPLSGASDPTTAVSEVSSVPASFTYDSDVLRKKLTALGEAVGPITSTTKRVYLRRLYRLQKDMPVHFSLPAAAHSPELEKLLTCVDWEVELLTYCKLETSMSASFENPDPIRRWREGLAKSSFNYLLLDPRISLNLPSKIVESDQSAWRQFISSIFYVGKGKRSRPYSHLYQAVRVWNKGRVPKNSNPKIKQIHEIWNDGYGVVCLHIFLNSIPVGALTREAAMIDALGLSTLGNLKVGEYYGPAATWRTRQKRQLGCYLLYRAMRVFLNEGERQLRPADID